MRNPKIKVNGGSVAKKKAACSLKFNVIQLVGSSSVLSSNSCSNDPASVYQRVGAGSRRLGVGSRRLGVGSRRLGVGSQRLGVGSGRSSQSSLKVSFSKKKLATALTASEHESLLSSASLFISQFSLFLDLTPAYNQCYII